VNGKLKDKIALITGGGSGIGRSTALLFAREGAKVVIADITTDAGQETVKRIVDAGGEAVFVETDMANPDDIENMVKATVDKYEGLDVLFNGAGIPMFAKAADVDVEEFDRVININLRGVFLGCKHAIPVMQQRGGGTIVSIASTAGITPNQYVSVYAAAKAGVMQLTKSIAIEYGADNIRINCICPGFIETPMTSLIIPEDTAARDYSHLWPLPSIGRPEDIAQAALYLACDDSSFVTGTALVVDGGWMVGTQMPISKSG